MGVQITSVKPHASKEKISHKQAECGNHKRQCPTDIHEIITAELKEALGVEELPVLSKPAIKRPPIEGLRVLKDFFICDRNECFSGFSSYDSLRQHRSTAHRDETGQKIRGNNRKGYCQTLFLNPATYFEVIFPLSSPTTPSSSKHTIDLSAFLRTKKAEMIPVQPLRVPSIDPQFIPPIFVEFGFHTFINTLDKDSISDYMSWDRKNIFSKLRELVVQSFIKDCAQLQTAHKSIREGIMGPLPLYVSLFHQ